MNLSQVLELSQENESCDHERDLLFKRKDGDKFFFRIIKHCGKLLAQETSDMGFPHEIYFFSLEDAVADDYDVHSMVRYDQVVNVVIR